MEDRKSLRELDREIGKWARYYPTDTLWRHRKSGAVYKITGHSAREHDGVVVIEFKPVRDTDNMVLTYVDGSARDHVTGEEVFYNLKHNRPAAEWEQEVVADAAVISDHVVMKSRFEQVERAFVFRPFRGERVNGVRNAR